MDLAPTLCDLPGSPIAATRPPRRAFVFLAFSLALMLFWPIFQDTGKYTWFLLLGIVLISYSRFHGAQFGVPCPELIFLASSFGGQYFFAFLPSSRIPSVDEFLLKFDAHFGYPEALAGKLCRLNPAIQQVIEIAYWGIPLAGILVYLSLPNKPDLRRKFVVTNALAFLIFFFYRICPAAGPRPLIGSAFPNAIPNLASPQARIIPDLTFNAVPSGHMTWALLLFWFALRYSGKAPRTGSAIFLLLTCVATLGKGEHYFIDLIVAVPFAAALWALGNCQWRRAALALAVTLLWCVTLREGWALPLPAPAVWLLCAASVIPFAVPAAPAYRSVRDLDRPVLPPVQIGKNYR